MTGNDTTTHTAAPLIMDGAMGSLIQEYGLGEEDFRGSRLRDSRVQMKGNNDVLSLTRPDIILDIHRRYLRAGADFIITDTFSAQRISQQEYMAGDMVEEMNREAVRLARQAVDEMAAAGDTRRRYVMGDVGPTSRMLSMSDDVSDPAARSVTFDEMATAYHEQIKTLLESGADGIIMETCFDTLNLKAALAAFADVTEPMATRPLLHVSMTISDASGRTLSGQTIEAFVESVMHARPDIIGMNCGLGAEAMVPYLRRMRKVIGGRCLVACHPNAGLPNEMGQYDDTPEDMVRQMMPMVREGLVDIIGGCCGTTPSHIEAFGRELRGYGGRTIAAIKPQTTADTPQGTANMADDGEKSERLTVTGLERFEFGKRDFVIVGERCNVAGSRKFLRLINEHKYDEALDIARTQIEKGAMVVDVNMDDGLLDTRKEMTQFLNLLMSDPSVCRVPVMVDSSRFDVIEAGLKCCQGKCIVNSISLKQGEETFVEQARRIKRLGAAVIVMLFDEEGQATDYERRISIAQRAYSLLVGKAAISPEDIIFDPNVLTIATGMDEHRRYALDFIRATRWITENLPGARVSGGLSNLSFAFRGNNYLREAMHSVFLHHAIEAGMNMAIMNPATAMRYEDIPGNLRDAIRRVILDETPDATERLTEMAGEILRQQQEAKARLDDVRRTPDGKDNNKQEATPQPDNTPEERLKKALAEGRHDTMERDIAELTQRGMSPLDIISGPLMEGMNIVGQLFGEGKMFLPQVVKTARAMKKAVAILLPERDSSPVGDNTGSSEVATNEGGHHGMGRVPGKTVVIATVKGDVHDIGKNIVGVVMACNGFHVIDLGVMVPPERIVDEAVRNNADIVCLSGLITPSLDEMCRVAELMQSHHLTIPIFVGGATTSEMHTAVRIAPLYGGSVFHMRDASQNPVVATQLADSRQREAVIMANRSRQQRLRMAHHKREQRLIVQRATSDALGEPTPLQRRFSCPWEEYRPALPPIEGLGEVRRIGIAELKGYIDWSYFYWAWRVREDSDEGRLLRDDAERKLTELAADSTMHIVTRQAFYTARGTSTSIKTGLVDIPTPRQAAIMPGGQRRSQCLALCDYVSPMGGDYIGVFAATVSEAFVRRLEEMKQTGNDDYETLLLQTIADRLAEAASEMMGAELARGYTSAKDGRRYSWHGIRPAVGYPSLPDQRAIFLLDKLMPYSELGIRLTENGAMYPQASVTGLYIQHPDSTYFSL